MNRIIKFRIWNVVNKQFDYNSESGGCYLISLNGEVKDGNGNPYDEYHIIQQFTGLQDSKGIEIYDGDILQWKEKISYKGFNKGVVEYGEYADDEYVENLECWMVYIIHKGEIMRNAYSVAPLSCAVKSCGVQFGRGLYCESETVEVIGNVFESEALLKNCVSENPGLLKN